MAFKYHPMEAETIRRIQSQFGIAINMEPYIPQEVSLEELAEREAQDDDDDDD